MAFVFFLLLLLFHPIDRIEIYNAFEMIPRYNDKFTY